MSKTTHSKLRADAPVFLPSFLRAQTENVENQQKSEASSLLDVKNQETLTSTNLTSEASASLALRNEGKKAEKLPAKDEWDEKLRIEVAEATELVWAQAEAWIEAEYEAEEEEWRILQMGIDEYVGLGGADSPLPLPPGLYPKYGTPESQTMSHKKPGLHISTVFEEVAYSSKTDGNTSASKLQRLQTPSRLRGAEHDPKSPNYHTPPFSAKSAIHSKLSSPDRRRSLSPSSLMKKYEAKLSAAEMNRDKSVAVKVQKASLVTNRVKERMQKAAEKQAQAEEALQDRLRNAEQRHTEHLNVIRERAGNENAKVSGVLTINYANSEALAVSLQQKLEEVEARILAASQRREQRLAGISGSQKKKNNRKVQQMSEFKLQLERQKMDRWEQLQQRLDQVKQRREARFAELKRRAEAEARRLEVMAALHSAEKEQGSQTGSGLGTPIRERYSARLEATPEVSNSYGSINIMSSPKERGKDAAANGDTNNVESDNQNSSNDQKVDSTLAKSSDSYSNLPVQEDYHTISEDVINKTLVEFSELKQRSKLAVAYQDCWKHCLAQSDKNANVLRLHNVVSDIIQINVAESTEERDASNKKIYLDVLKDIHAFTESKLPGNFSHNIVEKVNFLLPSEKKKEEKVEDFVQCGGLLIVAVLLSAEYGVLSSTNPEQFLWFLHLPDQKVKDGKEKKEDMNMDFIEYNNILLLLHTLLKQPISYGTIQLVVKYGIHISLFEISYVLLNLIQAQLSSNSSPSSHSKVSITTSPESPLVLKCANIYKLFNSVASLLTQIMSVMLSHSELAGAVISLMNFTFPCSYLSLVNSVGKTVLNYIPNAESVILKPSDRFYVFSALGELMCVQAHYVKRLKDQSHSTPIQAKHWLSLFRRNEVYILMMSFLHVYTEEMIPMVMKSCGGRVPADAIQSLSKLSCSILHSVNEVQQADSDAFNHLSKEQQHKLLTSLQISLCFYTTVLLNRSFPSVEESQPAHSEEIVDQAAISREDGVSEVCQIISHISKHSVEARQMINSVNSSPRGSSNKPLSSPGQSSLMATLASLPIRLMKEKRVKNALMPCLIISCLEVESNVNIIKRNGKASYVRKYLELAINEYLEAVRESGSSEQALNRKAKLRCLSDLLPTDMWEVALLSWTAEDSPAKSAKI